MYLHTDARTEASTSAISCRAPGESAAKAGGLAVVKAVGSTADSSDNRVTDVTVGPLSKEALNGLVPGDAGAAPRALRPCCPVTEVA